MNRFRVYCGPTLVPSLVRELTDTVWHVWAGTEHVYVETYCTAEELVRLLNSVMSGFTLRDVHCLNGSA